MTTGSVVVSGKGKHKTEEYAPATVFAAGDTVHGPDLVVTAMLGARRAAESIHDYLETVDG